MKTILNITQNSTSSDHNNLPTQPYIIRGTTLTLHSYSYVPTRLIKRSAATNCHPATMEYHLGCAQAADTMRPSDRRKARANVLRSRRNQRAIICEQGPSSILGTFLPRKNSMTDAPIPVFEDIIEDKKIARKLRNRASALASRNKRTDEIEMLTYRLGNYIPMKS